MKTKKQQLQKRAIFSFIAGIIAFVLFSTLNRFPFPTLPWNLFLGIILLASFFILSIFAASIADLFILWTNTIRLFRKKSSEKEIILDDGLTLDKDDDELIIGSDNGIF